MCFSARVQQNLRELARRFSADVDWAMFEEIFRRRLEDDGIKLARELERNFFDPEDDLQRRVKEQIDVFRSRRTTRCETELFKKKRLADAQRSLNVKETKRAREDQRIATNKIQEYVDRLVDVRRIEPNDEDPRIFPMYFAPVLVMDRNRLVVRPMRYACRLAGKPANYDQRFPGTYSTRRDSLNDFWSGSFGRDHAVIVANSFYENVPEHVYRRRELKPNEKSGNLVLHFNPCPPMDMLVACVWSHWTSPNEKDLYSFAAITDEPSAEIAAAGHNRCIIPIREENVREWLSSKDASQARLQEILNDRQRPFYEHRIAA
jgi:putative SOS response-associated peptidase YedK